MKFTGTKSYIATDDLSLSVNAAIALERPLLIKGEPGTGKTMLALEVAKSLDLPLIEWHIKSTTKAQQGLYEYDAVTRLRDSQLGDERVKDISNYIQKGKLWEAFTSEKQAVLLIDEIDRSDEEFEALLLEILAENQVTIPEFGTINGNDNRITILTSNGTRELSDALKRRCIYFYLDFPSIDIESKVLMNSIEEISEAQAKSYASFISFVRKLNLNKIPSLIESVEWVKYNFLNKNKSTIDNLGVLLKDKSDQEKYKEQIENANELIQE